MRKDRKHENGDVILVFLKIHIPFKHRSDLESDDLESIWIEICQKNSKSFLICFVYRPPHPSIEWISSFNVQVQKVDDLCKEYHIIGDLNY